MESVVNEINIEKIVLFDNIRTDKIINLAVGIHNVMCGRKFEELYDETLAQDCYFTVQRELLSFADFEKSNERKKGEVKETLWQNYVSYLVLTGENKFSLLAEKNLQNEGLEKLLFKDLEKIALIYNLDWGELSRFYENEDICVASMEDKSSCVVLKTKGNNSYNDMAHTLYDHYSKKGAGILSAYSAFFWKDGELKGMKNYDAITFDTIIGYEIQRAQLIENTEFLLKGKKGNNVLLFGDRGTGKSSSVKALLHMFADRKLKLIAVKKNQLTELTEIFDWVENRGCKFILFLDDLSFTEDEIEYKSFKSIIEGGLGKQPDNLLIYVTTNRRHLIRETWKDRSSELGDIYQNDGIHERTSLAERFGLQLTYSAPNKAEYLEIIRELAKFEGLLPKNKNVKESLDAICILEAEALKWEVRHNGRSGRTAKQFINFMKSKKEDII